MARASNSDPFPGWTVFVICLGMFGCAFNMSVLFPFTPFLVEDLGMVEDPRKPGYYAGFLTSAQQAGRIVTSVFWGAYSDRHGRKSTAYISLVTTAATAIAFGLAQNYWLAVALRGINGLCDFMLGTAKMLITELVAPVHQPRAMSYLGACWGTAVIIGPSVGGFFARPALKYPELFDPDSFLARYPYALPNLITAGLCAVAILLMRTLPEPLAGRIAPACGRASQNTAQRRKHAGDSAATSISPVETNGDFAEREGEEQASLLDEFGDDFGEEVVDEFNDRQRPEKNESKLSPGREMLSFCTEKKPRLAIMFYTVAMVIEFTDPMLLSLWASAPASAGGLGYNTSLIGSVLAVTGATLIVFQVTIYPSLNRRYGTLGLLRRLVVLQTPIWCAIPLSSLSVVAACGPTAQFAVVSAVFAIRKALAEMSFTNMNMVLNNAVPASRRGLYNGFSISVSGLGKMGGPAVGGPLFAWSLTNGYGWPLDHSLTFYVAAFVTLLVWWITLRMPESIGRPYHEVGSK